MKKNFAIALIASVAVSIFMALIAWLTTPPNNAMVSLPEDAENLYPETDCYVVGYDRSGTAYTPNSDDPQIGFIFPERDIGRVVIEFKRPLEQDLPIQIYYAVNGQALAEGNSFHQIVESGSSFAVVDFGGSKYTQIRLDINGRFRLRRIYTTQEYPATNYTRNSSQMASSFLFTWFVSYILSFIFLHIGKATVEMSTCSQADAPYSEFSRNKQKHICGCIILDLFLISSVLQGICLYKPVEQDPFNGALFSIPTIAALGVCITSLLLWFKGGKNSRKLILYWGVAVVLSGAAAMRLNVWINVRLALYVVVMIAIWLIGPLVFAKEVLRGVVSQIRKYIPGLIRFFAVLIVSCGMGIVAELAYSFYAGEDWVWGKTLFFFLTILVVLVSVIFYKELAKKPEKSFLLMALPVGLFMCVAGPIAPVSWDEQIHYARTVYLSQGDYAVFTEADNSIASITASSSLSEDQSRQNRKMLQKQYIGGTDAVEENKQATSLPRIGYLPSAMGMWLGRILHAPFACVYMLGKIGNLLFYVAIIYFAIKKLENGKILLLIIGLLPTNLFLASSYSYDPWVTALTALGLAYFWSALQRPYEKLTGVECVIMMGALFFASLPKLVYLILLLILLAMPQQKFSSHAILKQYRIAVCICILAALGLLFQSSIIGGASGGWTDARGGSEVNGREQFIYVFTHPFSYAKTLLRFLWTYIHPENSAAYMTFFAYMGSTGKHTVIFTMLCVAALTDYKTEGPENRPYLRIVSAVVLFATVAAIASALYVMFTPVAHTTVNGCQPRYLLPLLFPCFAFVFGHYKITNVNWNAYRTTFYALNFYNVFSTVWWIIASKITP